MRRPGWVSAVLVLAVTGSVLVAPSAGAQPTSLSTPLPTTAQLAAAMLTPAQLRTLALRAISGRGATFPTSPEDSAVELSPDGALLDGYVSADAKSPRNGYARNVTVYVTYGVSDSESVCPDEPDAQFQMIAKDECAAFRSFFGARDPEVVAVRIRPASGVAVMAAVGNSLPGLPIRDWRTPTRAAMLKAAMRVAHAQVARLRARHLIP